jgi:hypothetical protein
VFRIVTARDTQLDQGNALGYRIESLDDDKFTLWLRIKSPEIEKHSAIAEAYAERYIKTWRRSQTAPEDEMVFLMKSEHA